MQMIRKYILTILLCNIAITITTNIFNINIVSAAPGVVTCAMTTINNMNFGRYYPTSSNFSPVTSTITVTCNNGMSSTQTVGFTLCFSTGSSNNYAQRTMLSGSQNLVYNFYSTNGYTQILGDGNDSTVYFFIYYNLAASASRSDTLPLYGKIPVQSSARVGSYIDTINATLSYGNQNP
ncbi:MAG: SCPU domain-containing protein [Rickettsiaceae bacterium]|nr:MAG: SCPU domain-containing protein [Rickettsiaceae bacterium]